MHQRPQDLARRWYMLPALLKNVTRLRWKQHSGKGTVVNGLFVMGTLGMLLLVVISLFPVLNQNDQNRHLQVVAVEENGSSPQSALLAPPEQRPIALVYRGPGGCDGCSEAVAELLQSSKWNFEVKYVGPKEHLKVSEAVLKTAALYAQPGGSGTLEGAYAALSGDAQVIRNFVKSGGHYLGFCMGGYLAGKGPGFNLLPGDSDQYIALRGASVKTEKDTVIQVKWRDKSRYMYFQDGPYFIVKQNAKDVKILATYTNGKVAALVAPYGKGVVGVSGPHPEATSDWYQSNKVHDPDGPDADLGRDLINTVMQ